MVQEIIDKLIERNYNFIKKNLTYTKGASLTILIPDTARDISKLYVNNIKKNFKEFLPEVKIDIENCYYMNLPKALKTTVDLCISRNSRGLIIMSPFQPKDEDYFTQYNIEQILNRIPKALDLDRLSNKYKGLLKDKYLPITSYGIWEILQEIKGNIENLNVCLVGNGLTVNSHLNNFLLRQKGYQVFNVKRDTPDELKRNIYKICDVIIGATGEPEMLKEEELKGKMVITTCISKKGNIFVSELAEELRNSVDTNDVLGGIGKLTMSTLLCRFINNCKESATWEKMI